MPHPVCHASGQVGLPAEGGDRGADGAGQKCVDAEKNGGGGAEEGGPTGATELRARRTGRVWRSEDVETWGDGTKRRGGRREGTPSQALETFSEGTDLRGNSDRQGRVAHRRCESRGCPLCTEEPSSRQPHGCSVSSLMEKAPLAHQGRVVEVGLALERGKGRQVHVALGQGSCSANLGAVE